MKKTPLKISAVAMVVGLVASAGGYASAESKASSYKDMPIIATSNPAGAADDALVGVSKNLKEAIAKFSNFDSVTSIQSVKLADNGSAFVTYDAPNMTGGVLKVNNVNTSSDFTVVTGPETSTLKAPRGIELVPERNSYIVSDNGAKAIVVFSNDSAAPMFTVNNLGLASRNVWDTSYDKRTDTLYVAGTDGVVVVYDDFYADKGVYGPTKLIVPANRAGAKISVNLHGIEYDARHDVLALSDVGDAASAVDGQIFTINDVREASGRTEVRARVSGPTSGLGNPVDVELDGRDLLVAEKSNDKVLRYDNILSRRGESSSQASRMIQVIKPESVAQYQ